MSNAKQWNTFPIKVPNNFRHLIRIFTPQLFAQLFFPPEIISQQRTVENLPSKFLLNSLWVKSFTNMRISNVFIEFRHQQREIPLNQSVDSITTLALQKQQRNF